MAPKKIIPRPKVANTSVGIRQSKHLKVINSNKSGRHHDEAQSVEINGIPQLNDKCLPEIFSYLPIRDLLYNVAICSHRFNTLATGPKN